jgi:hypothetical protein
MPVVFDNPLRPPPLPPERQALLDRELLAARERCREVLG